MSEHFDIEKRARELLRESQWFVRDDLVLRAAQLAREAADARAEEIAQLLSRALMGDLHCTPSSFNRDAAALARLTITKPKEPFSRGLSDAECDAFGYERGTRIEGGDNHFTVIDPAPKTREQVLEEALREIAKKCEREAWGGYDPSVSRPDVAKIARRALEWKP